MIKRRSIAIVGASILALLASTVASSAAENYAVPDANTGKPKIIRAIECAAGVLCPMVTMETGLGTLTVVPAASTNGTALGIYPAKAKGVRFYLGSGDSITFTVAAVAPTSAPSLTFTISGAATGTGPNWDENLSGGQMIYVTAKTGAPIFRWF